MFDIADTSKVNGARIKVVGVGGGGCNAVNTMIRSGLTGVEYIVANTDSQALAASLAEIRIQLGSEVTKGLGAGANPDVGRKAAMEDYEKLSDVLAGADMVFVTAGMGGGTGTGAAPVIAKLCKELGILTVGVVTKPFQFEGKKRSRQADSGIRALEESVDSLICIPNQRLLQLAGESLSLVDTFKKADEVLLNAVQGISDLINNTGLINADFADVKTVMENKGLALMGTGLASGSDRATKAAKEAISSPLLEDISIHGATGIIINITGSSLLTTHETNQAVTLIMEAADEDAEIIFGTVIDENLKDQIKITVVATGLRTIKSEEILATPIRTVPTPERMEEIRQAARPQYQEEVRPQLFRNDQLEAASYQQKMEVPTDREESPSVRSSSHLTSALKEAAKRYETKKGEPEITAAPIQRPVISESKIEAPIFEETAAPTPLTPKDSKIKSIAEKLGFMNFDEDEFDTPSFLKRDRNADNSPMN